ncbi:hypothetical protein HF264_25975 [Rhizobium leguminosarum]|jgi:hypothetical protein|uniref:hypothetical protein n=1 Tax=Rhizobium TaxID=379 RepID=UPI001C902179|nr:hypothetical protein [Rhizobium leguminosarum]MBY2943106.1 hypothetical protein [Rhizobium leguminosarum]
MTSDAACLCPFQSPFALVTSSLTSSLVGFCQVTAKGLVRRASIIGLFYITSCPLQEGYAVSKLREAAAILTFTLVMFISISYFRRDEAPPPENKEADIYGTGTVFYNQQSAVGASELAIVRQLAKWPMREVQSFVDELLETFKKNEPSPRAEKLLSVLQGSSVTVVDASHMISDKRSIDSLVSYREAIEKTYCLDVEVPPIPSDLGGAATEHLEPFSIKGNPNVFILQAIERCQDRWQSKGLIKQDIGLKIAAIVTSRIRDSKAARR